MVESPNERIIKRNRITVLLSSRRAGVNLIIYAYRGDEKHGSKVIPTRFSPVSAQIFLHKPTRKINNLACVSEILQLKISILLAPIQAG